MIMVMILMIMTPKTKKLSLLLSLYLDSGPSLPELQASRIINHWLSPVINRRKNSKRLGRSADPYDSLGAPGGGRTSPDIKHVFLLVELQHTESGAGAIIFLLSGMVYSNTWLCCLTFIITLSFLCQ